MNAEVYTNSKSWVGDYTTSSRSSHPIVWLLGGGYSYNFRSLTNRVTIHDTSVETKTYNDIAYAPKDTRSDKLSQSGTYFSHGVTASSLAVGTGGAIESGFTMEVNGKVRIKGDSTVEGALELASASVSGDASVSGAMSAASASVSGDASVGGKMSAASATVSGEASVGGTISAASASFSGDVGVGGEVNGASVSVSGAVQAASVSVSGAVQAASASIGGDASVGGMVSAATATFSSEVQAASAAFSGDVTSTGSITADGTVTAPSFKHQHKAFTVGGNATTYYPIAFNDGDCAHGWQ